MRTCLGICWCLCFMAIVPPAFVKAQSCAAPGPCSCTSCQKSRDVAPREAAPRGYYSRSPDTGEFSGENNSIGVRGFGFRLPAISIELPELRLPSMARYRRGPHMTTDSARAAWVEGRALEFNPVGPERDSTDRSVTPFNTRGAPSCVAPAPRSCDAPSAPAVEARNQTPASGLNGRDAELLLLREQAVSLQKAIDSLATSRVVSEEVSEREQLRRKEREVDELRAEIQRMQSIMAKDAPRGEQPAKTEVARIENRKPQTSTQVRPASVEVPQASRATSKPGLQQGACNGPQCRTPNFQTQSQQGPVFEQPVVNKTQTAARMSNFRPSSILGR